MSIIENITLDEIYEIIYDNTKLPEDIINVIVKFGKCYEEDCHNTSVQNTEENVTTKLCTMRGQRCYECTGCFIAIYGDDEGFGLGEMYCMECISYYYIDICDIIRSGMNHFSNINHYKYNRYFGCNKYCCSETYL